MTRASASTAATTTWTDSSTAKIPTARAAPTTSGGELHEVGGLDPNACGLYDMTGNAFEWTQDYYASDYYDESPTVDPEGPTSGSARSRRGGAVSYPPSRCRVADRNSLNAGDTRDDTGLRVVKNAD